MRRLIHFSNAHKTFFILSPTDMSQASLSTMQRNALGQFLGRKEFTPEEVAELDYCVVVHLPKNGSKGIETIRNWLQQHGRDLRNLPDQKPGHADKRLNRRLQNAARLLQKYGYRVAPP